ncbi:MAG: beta-ketoacyl-[acyl-carrier-protein] synthase II [Sphingobacteriales bacterium]|nr:MAG: beta-ketoacyl-[acyl-carrier-protein] synthase II [Sphingobacteriales bacterium]
MKIRRVVVTGLGALTPIGNDVESYWQGLVAGKSGSDFITKFDASKFRTKFAAEVKDFSPELYMDKKEARKIDIFSQYALAVAEQAVQDSGLNLESINRNRAGVIWGSGIGGLKTFLDEVTDFTKGDGTPRFNPFFIPKMIIDLAPGHISIKYGFRGVNYGTVSACASSSNAIAEAFNYIRYGKADVMITGGSEAVINEAAVGGFNAMRALSERNDDPKTASRPFDKNRDGFLLGEGAGGLILEEYEHAMARGAKIYAEIAGSGMSADAYHITAPHPEGLGAQLVMANVLEDAEMTVADIDYINVHGTSTPLGDVSELIAIQKVFGDDAYRVNISSTKSMTGHLLGAAGSIEAIASILAIKNGIVPPTINHFEDDPEIDSRLNLTFNEPQKREIRAAMSNTFGFGGHNASLIFKKFEA